MRQSGLMSFFGGKKSNPPAEAVKQGKEVSQVSVSPQKSNKDSKNGDSGPVEKKKSS
jgi:hypothetical protein